MFHKNTGYKNPVLIEVPPPRLEPGASRCLRDFSQTLRKDQTTAAHSTTELRWVFDKHRKNGDCFDALNSFTFFRKHSKKNQTLSET